MFNCFIVNCDSKLLNRKLYIRHLKDHETLSAITFPAFCMPPGCSKKSTYFDFNSLNRHLREKHDAENEINAWEEDFLSNPTTKNKFIQCKRKRVECV